MPQRVITVYICSLCEHEYREDPSGTFTLTFADGRVLNYDACPDCRAEEPLATVLAAGEDANPKKRPLKVRYSPAPAAVPTPPVVKESAGFPCPECADAGTPYTAKNPQGLGAHRNRAHGVIGAKKKKAA